MKETAEHEAETAPATPAAAAPAMVTPTAAPELARVQELARTIGNRGTGIVLARQKTKTPPKTLTELAEAGDAKAIADRTDLKGIGNQELTRKLLVALSGPAKPTRKMLKAMEILWQGLPAKDHAARSWLYKDAVKKGAKLPRWMPGDDLTLILQTRPGVMTRHQAARVKPAIERLSLDDYCELRSLTENADTDTHKGFLFKALAARRTVADLKQFWWDIWLQDENWLMRNLSAVNAATAVGSTSAGIAQQWQMSCGPTGVQTLHAQTDPIYALSLNRGGNLSAQNQGNATLTSEQGTILQSHGSTPTPIGTAGGGAWVESDLNALRSQTGFKYTFTRVLAVAGGNPKNGAVDRAWKAICGFLDRGIVVPLLIGGAPGGNDHYVMALRRDGDNMLINDQGLGLTAWVSKAQVMANNMSPPLSWPFLQGYDKPKETA